MNRTTAKRIVTAIRNKYPNPIKFESPIDCDLPAGSYCVGGAFLCAVEGMEPTSMDAFPDDAALAITFWSQVGIKLDAANAVANVIVDANDRGDFEEAWTALEDTLCSNDHECELMSPNLLDLLIKFDKQQAEQNTCPAWQEEVVEEVDAMLV